MPSVHSLGQGLHQGRALDLVVPEIARHQMHDAAVRKLVEQVEDLLCCFAPVGDLQHERQNFPCDFFCVLAGGVEPM